MGYNKVELDKLHHRQTDDSSRGRPACPFCGSNETDLLSLFGQQLLTVQLYCNTCHTPFECIKDDSILDVYATRKEG